MDKVMIQIEVFKENAYLGFSWKAEGICCSIPSSFCGVENFPHNMLAVEGICFTISGIRCCEEGE